MAKSDKANAPKTLIVAEYRPIEKGVGDYTELFAYRFKQGVLESRRRIFGAPVHRKDDLYYSVRFDLGLSTLLFNRYIVSGTGNVIDSETGRLLTTHGDELVKATPEYLLFYRANIDIGTGYLRLDLPGGEYGFVEGPSRPPGLASPDLQHWLVTKQQKGRYSIEIVDRSGRLRAVLDDAGEGTAPVGGGFVDVPMAWTSANSFVYAKSERNNTCIFEFDLTTNRATSLGGLKLKGGCEFERDLEGTLMLRCSTGCYRVIPNLPKMPMKKLGHGFETPRDAEAEQPLFYDHQLIGRLHCETYNAKTTDGYLAVAYAQTGENLGYPEGFKVWSASTRSWTTFKPDWFCNFVGWVEDR